MSETPMLLMTKIALPVTRSALIDRPRLHAHLQQALDCPLTLVCAPAGAGKTTIITAWFEALGGTQPPLAWVSLDEDDNDAAQFVSYVAAALDTIVPGALDLITPMRDSLMMPSGQTLATALIHHVDATATDCLLVLDDYHRINADEVHEIVSFLIEHMPPQMHLMITTREDPPLPLARLRARGLMVEIREAELRFTRDETVQFLHQLFGLTLTDAQVAALDERIEGWAAGLKLAALAMRERNDVGAFIEAFSGSHRFVLDYLMEEVFERQPPDMKTFLLDTAFLREINSDLCNAVTGRNDAQELIERLVRLNLFTIALDDDDRWFRYHHLFADVLKNRRVRAMGATPQDFYRRAAAWYIEQRQFPTAMHYLLETGAYDDAAHLIAQYGFYVVEEEGYELPLRWLRQIPAEALAGFPDLLLLAVFNYIKTDRSRSPEVKRLLDQAQASVHALPGDAAQILQAKIDVLVGILAQELDNDLERSEQMIDRALPYLAEDAVWYCGAAMQKAWIYLMKGEIEPTVAIAMDSARIAEQHHLINPLMEAYKVAGIALQYDGRFTEALRVLSAATAKAKTLRKTHYIELANVYFNVARIALLHTDFALTESGCHETLAISERAGVMALTIPAWLTLAETKWYVGAFDEAGRLWMQARVALEEHPEINNMVEKSTAALLAVQMGDTEYARQWVHTIGFNPRPVPDALAGYFEDVPQLLFHIQWLHVLIGDLERSVQPLSSWSSVLMWAEHLHASAVERKAVLWEIRGLALLAVARHTCRQSEEALDALRSALVQAEPEQLIYPFIACGAPLRSLVRKLHQRGEATEFSLRVLATFDAIEQRMKPSAMPLPESPFEALTEREREVLALVAEGYSNTEIAGKLYLSVGTIKRHIANVYIKLGAESRTQAIAIAREYNLL
ncbi:MAG: hypothetical protein IT320_11815 [Anaerolineae bacterium]|nr:hypothetical protein [Anaerolineae bacterium]